MKSSPSGLLYRSVALIEFWIYSGGDLWIGMHVYTILFQLVYKCAFLLGHFQFCLLYLDIPGTSLLGRWKPHYHLHIACFLCHRCLHHAHVPKSISLRYKGKKNIFPHFTVTVCLHTVSVVKKWRLTKVQIILCMCRWTFSCGHVACVPAGLVKELGSVNARG